LGKLETINDQYGVGFGLLHKDYFEHLYQGYADTNIIIDLIGCKKRDKVFGTIHDDWYFTYISKINEQESVNIYPNPVSDYLNIESNNLFEKAVVRVADIDGRVVLSRLIKGNTNRIDLTLLKPGVYNTTIISTNKVWSKVIVKL
jgi:hypothetical protein